MFYLRIPGSGSRIVGATVAVLTGAATIFAAAPSASAGGLGERSLVEVLDADGNKFDKNWKDFDIVHRAATTVLDAKPGSAVGVLADGSTAVTAFLPDDRAFRRLVFQLTGDRPGQEQATFAEVATLGVDTIEDVLLYHVVPGAPITYADAKQADGAALTTASSGLETEVAVIGNRVWLRDLDTDDQNPRVRYQARNINVGNKQIAHGITRVLRPADLP